jgi:hypothetical protein
MDTSRYLALSIKVVILLESVIVFNRFKTSSDALSEHKRKAAWFLEKRRCVIFHPAVNA